MRIHSSFAGGCYKDTNQLTNTSPGILVWTSLELRGASRPASGPELWKIPTAQVGWVGPVYE